MLLLMTINTVNNDNNNDNIVNNDNNVNNDSSHDDDVAMIMRHIQTYNSFKQKHAPVSSLKLKILI